MAAAISAQEEAMYKVILSHDAYSAANASVNAYYAYMLTTAPSVSSDTGAVDLTHQNSTLQIKFRLLSNEWRSCN